MPLIIQPPEPDSKALQGLLLPLNAPNRHLKYDDFVRYYARIDALYLDQGGLRNPADVSNPLKRQCCRACSRSMGTLIGQDTDDLIALPGVTNQLSPAIGILLEILKALLSSIGSSGRLLMLRSPPKSKRDMGASAVAVYRAKIPLLSRITTWAVPDEP